MSWKHKVGLGSSHLLQTLRMMRSYRRVGRERVLEFQNACLRRLVAHAYRNVPYYRRLFDRNGISPRDIRTVGDLRAIPITEKNDLRDVPVADTVARGVDPGGLESSRTSGSSGEPFTIRSTWLEARIWCLLWARAMRYLGMRARDRAASVLYMRPGRRPEDRNSYQRILNSFGLFRHVYVDCCPQPEDILRVLRRYRPDVLGGYPGALSLLAEATTERDRREISPRILAAGGEVLTGAMREQIRRGFQAPVYNLYGSNELPLIAWECKETGELHTCDDGVIVEVLKNGRPAGPGEQGELVGTNLHSFAMPFIRYRQGDVVTRGAGRCACGQPFSTIRAIEGRTIDYFTLPDGRLMHPYQTVYAVLDAAPWLRRYQLVQERQDLFVLRVVPAAEPSAEERQRLAEAVRQALGPGVEFRVVLVPGIEPGPGGKFQAFRPLVDPADREPPAATGGQESP